MNLKKCLPPARKMEILGFLYDAITRYCRLSKTKQEKYIERIDETLKATLITAKNLEKLVGYLTYAEWVAPFGRPFFVSFTEENNPVCEKAANFSISCYEKCVGNLEDDFNEKSRTFL